MTVLRQVVDSASDGTLKGRVISAVGAQFQGANMEATLDLTGGVIVDGETFSLGDTNFEFNDCSTAETAVGTTTSATDISVALDVAPDRDFVKDEVFGIGSEYCKVTSHVAGSTTVFVERGYAGSTAATHTGATITRVAAARLPVSGNLVIPVNDLTQAEAETKTIAAVPALSSYTARDGGTNLVVFSTPYSDGHAANSIVSANSNTLSNFSGGHDSFSGSGKAEFVHAVTAGEATAGTLAFEFASTPVAASATLLDDSGGVQAFDTTTAISGNVVTLTEGATAWEGGADRIVVEVWF